MFAIPFIQFHFPSWITGRNNEPYSPRDLPIANEGQRQGVKNPLSVAADYTAPWITSIIFLTTWQRRHNDMALPLRQIPHRPPQIRSVAVLCQWRTASLAAGQMALAPVSNRDQPAVLTLVVWNYPILLLVFSTNQQWQLDLNISP